MAPGEVSLSNGQQIDFSQPVSVLLKNSTQRVHETVENSPGARALTSGTLPRQEYIKYLFILWHLYDALESRLDAHCTHPSLAPTYNPAILRRADALSSDISHFLSCTTTSPAEWQQHPLYTDSFLPLPASLVRYISRLDMITQSSDPTPLLAHSYVRYLGDLSGGQYIKRILLKTYHVDETFMTFYEFRKLGGDHGTEMVGMGDMRKLKDWFKKGLDEGVGEDVTKKEELLKEVQLAFQLNGALLDSLVVDSKAKTSPAPTLDPTSRYSTPAASTSALLASPSPFAYSTTTALQVAGIALATSALLAFIGIHRGYTGYTVTRHLTDHAI